MPKSKKQTEVDLLVDTGSTYSWIKGSTLRRLGVKPKSKMLFATIEGRNIQREVGDVFMRCEGRDGPSTVVFANPQDAEVLGLHALEGLALEVHPVQKRLIRSQAVMAI